MTSNIAIGENGIYKMSVDIFSKEQFEAALPTQARWEHVGLMGGEHTYLMTINADIFIMIRSSVGHNGWSADTGEDSIRAWLVDKDGKPLGNKVQKYITRVNGWESRLIDNLRTLWGWAEWAGYCPDCKEPMCIFKSTQPRSKGKLFKKCCKCQNHFEWMEK